MNAYVIDAFEFSRLKEHREGDIAVLNLSRFSQDVTGKSGSVHWSLQGGSDALGHPQLKVSVSGAVQLMCQRCLSPFAFNIASESILVLASDDAQADEIDALLDNDAIDVIVGSKTLNVLELLEDEALLAIPQAPKHEVCPDQAALAALTGVKSPSPFAKLKEIKH